jgi:hypothetical protein
VSAGGQRSGWFLRVEHRLDLSEHLAQFGDSLTSSCTGVERQSFACFHRAVPLRGEYHEDGRDGVVDVGAVLSIRQDQRFSHDRESRSVLSPEQRPCGLKGHKGVMDIKDQSKQWLSRFRHLRESRQGTTGVGSILIVVAGRELNQRSDNRASSVLIHGGIVPYANATARCTPGPRNDRSTADPCSGSASPAERARLGRGLADMFLRGGHVEEDDAMALRGVAETRYYYPPYEFECLTFPKLHARLRITEEVLVAWNFQEVIPEVFLEELQTACELLFEETINRRSKRLSFAELIARGGQCKRLRRSRCSRRISEGNSFRRTPDAAQGSAKGRTTPSCFGLS